MRISGLAAAALVAMTLAAGSHVRAEGDYKVEALKEAPTGLAAEIAKRINADGFRVSSDSGVVCDVWLAKDVPTKPGFKPTDVVKYPFQPGELAGAIRFPEQAEAGDFRGQMVPPGTYTLRYGQQPNDGNHLGTSEVRDFVLICNAKDDVDPKRIEKNPDLFKLSAKSVNTTHPAVFQMQPPPEKPHAAPGATFDEEKHTLVVHLNADVSKDGKPVKIPVNVVVVGKSEG